jgi:hypothetical protein
MTRDVRAENFIRLAEMVGDRMMAAQIDGTAAPLHGI